MGSGLAFIMKYPCNSSWEEGMSTYLPVCEDLKLCGRILPVAMVFCVRRKTSIIIGVFGVVDS